MLSQDPFFYLTCNYHCIVLQAGLTYQPSFPVCVQTAHKLCRSLEKGGRGWAARGAGESVCSSKLMLFQEENPLWGSPSFVSDNRKMLYSLKQGMCLCLSAPFFYFYKFWDRLSLPEFETTIILLLFFICFGCFSAMRIIGEKERERERAREEESLSLSPPSLSPSLLSLPPSFPPSGLFKRGVYKTGKVQLCWPLWMGKRPIL